MKLNSTYPWSQWIKQLTFTLNDWLGKSAYSCPANRLHMSASCDVGSQSLGSLLWASSGGQQQQDCAIFLFLLWLLILFPLLIIFCFFICCQCQIVAAHGKRAESIKCLMPIKVMPAQYYIASISNNRCLFTSLEETLQALHDWISFAHLVTFWYSVTIVSSLLWGCSAVQRVYYTYILWMQQWQIPLANNHHPRLTRNHVQQ